MVKGEGGWVRDTCCRASSVGESIKASKIEKQGGKLDYKEPGLFCYSSAEPSPKFLYRSFLALIFIRTIRTTLATT